LVTPRATEQCRAGVVKNCGQYGLTHSTVIQLAVLVSRNVRCHDDVAGHLVRSEMVAYVQRDALHSWWRRLRPRIEFDQRAHYC
jgi:hypothetical protein